MPAALRRVPVPLLVAQVAGVVAPLFVIADIPLHSVGGHANPVAEIMFAGTRYAYPVLSIVGLVWLARGLSGAARVGARMASVAIASGLVLQLVVLGLVVFQFEAKIALSSAVIFVESAIRATCAVAVAVGLGLATRRWFWIVIAVVAAVFADPIWFVWEWLHDGLDGPGVLLLSQCLVLVQGAIQLAMVVFASRDASPIDEPPVGRGLARCALALRGFAIAIAALAGLTVIAMQPENRYELHPSIFLVMAVVTAFELACLLALALAALSTIRRRDAMPAWLVAASCLITLIIASGLVGRVVTLVERYFSRWVPQSHLADWDGSRDPDRLVPAVSWHLFVALAISALVVALALAARRRGLEGLRRRAITSSCLVVGLAIIAVTGQRVIAHEHVMTSLRGTIVVITTSVLAGAWLLAARVLRRGAAELEGAESLPTAKLIR